MKRTRFTEEQIIGVSKEHPAASGRRTVGDQPHLPALSRRRPDGGQATGAAAPQGTRAPTLADAANACWFLDLVHDPLSCGRQFRGFSQLSAQSNWNSRILTINCQPTIGSQKSDLDRKRYRAPNSGSGVVVCPQPNLRCAPSSAHWRINRGRAPT